ncbi:MAG: zinc-dependent dehydrogenase [Gemmatimonadota bacterium]|nr:MAG: zinc-dependent dehydrogenase [Gemmatimonadota bacterium]
MRVAMYYNNQDVRLEEMSVPQIGPSEILVKVMASGICGSDVMEWYRLKKAPLVLGHEITGEIVEVGKGVTYKVGDRVFVSHHVPCNECRYCQDGHHTVCDTLRSTNFDPGGFAEYLRVPPINVACGTFLLPDEISYEDGTFIEPLACVLRGQRIAHFQSGQSVLVLGSGLSGLLHIKLARALGASRIVATDIHEYRLEVAKRSGADAVIHAEEFTPAYLREQNNGCLADLVIVCTGAIPAIHQAFHSTERGGTILFFAPTEPSVEIPFPMWDLWRDQITMLSTYAGSPEDIMQAIELVRARKVDVRDMITHRLGLAETGLGFQLVLKAQDSIKVIIEPQR